MNVNESVLKAFERIGSDGVDQIVRVVHAMLDMEEWGDRPLSYSYDDVAGWCFSIADDFIVGEVVLQLANEMESYGLSREEAVLLVRTLFDV